MIRQVLRAAFRAAARAGGIQRRRTIGILTLVITGCFVLVGLPTGDEDQAHFERCRSAPSISEYPFLTRPFHPHH